jgi:hypothetical protein
MGEEEKEGSRVAQGGGGGLCFRVLTCSSARCRKKFLSHFARWHKRSRLGRGGVLLNIVRGGRRERGGGGDLCLVLGLRCSIFVH